MHCKQVQKLLESDYLDGQTTEQMNRLIEGHLAQCLVCSALFGKLQGQRATLRSAGEILPGQQVWENIRETIINEQLEGGSVIFAPRPVFALATALTVLIFVAVIIGPFKKHAIREHANGFADYNVVNGDEGLITGLGTEIEEYFL